MGIQIEAVDTAAVRAFDRRMIDRKHGPLPISPPHHMESKNHQTDPDLEMVLRMRDKDDNTAAWREFGARYETKIRSILAHYSPPGSDIDNEYGEFIAQLWNKKLLTFDPARGKFAPWLLHSAKNYAIDRLRSRGRQPMHLSLDEALDPGQDGSASFADMLQTHETPEQSLLDAEHQTNVRQRLASLLSEKHYALIDAIFLRGLSYDEAARELGLTMGQVKSRVSVAMSKLRNHSNLFNLAR